MCGFGIYCNISNWGTAPIQFQHSPITLFVYINCVLYVCLHTAGGDADEGDADDDWGLEEGDDAV